jgi:hypothetical protein
VRQSEQRPNRRTDPKYPGTDYKVWLYRGSPRDYGQQNQNGQPDPFEDSASPWKFMGIVPTFDAIPVFPEATWQQRDPEDVTHIKSANLFGPSFFAATEAVVVAERDTFRPPMVDTINDKHFSATSILPFSEDCRIA